jgi:large subunit ribosomal protein L23
MNPYDVLIKPMLTEKSTNQRHDANKVSFEVEIKSTKLDVKKAVEKLFNVNVVKVNTCLTRGKYRRRGAHYYRSEKVKKAVVTVKAGQKISVFED